MPDRRKKKLPDTLLTSASAGDCTGLIPAGDDLDEEEYEEYEELYPFGAPND